MIISNIKNLILRKRLCPVLFFKGKLHIDEIRQRVDTHGFRHSCVIQMCLLLDEKSVTHQN